MKTKDTREKTPRQLEVEAGKTYVWCACGHSAKQPFCDGSHFGTGSSPVVFKAPESKTVHLCMCKQTGTRPFCDGTHSKHDL